MHTHAYSFALALSLSLPALGAGTLAASTFDAGDDGWLVGDFFGGGSSPTISYVPGDGNPGGHVTAGDQYGWNGLVAPAKFLGNKLDAYGGALLVDQRIASADSVLYPLAVLSDGVTTLQFFPPDGQNPSPGIWHSYLIPLRAIAGWQVANGSGDPNSPLATEQQLAAVLTNLTLLSFEADWQTGSDAVDLDNVFLIAGNGQNPLLPGDANLNGVIDPDDFTLTDRGFAQNRTGWTNGDFNADNVVDAADYQLLDQSLRNQSGHFSPDHFLPPIPEPSSLFLLATGYWLLNATRHRRP